MRQIGLFPGFDDPAPEAPPAPEAEDPLVGLAPTDEVLAGQLHLFGDRAVRRGRARGANAEARLDDAKKELGELKKRFKDDPFIAREAALTTRLAKRLATALASPPHARAAALLALARGALAAEEPWISLRRALLRRAAVELEAAGGAAATLEGQLAGAYLIEAGALDEARASLEAALAVQRSARALLLLADANTLLDRRAAARRCYLEALLLDPFDAALDAARDEEVRALPGVVRYELEIDAEAEAWSAPAGVVTGVLPSPVGLPASALAPRDEMPAAWTAARREAVSRARAFVRALAEAASQGREAIVETRREMKRLSPELFAAYMERVVRGKAT
jgi:hypothetical protein